MKYIFGFVYYKWNFKKNYKKSALHLFYNLRYYLDMSYCKVPEDCTTGVCEDITFTKFPQPSEQNEKEK
jgi:hypothetical protein